MKKTAKNNVMQLFGWCLVSLCVLSCNQKQVSTNITQEDKEAIETLARDLPLILSNQGWDAYANTFSDDYVNWSMVGDNVRSREDYLALVKDWYDKGNRATGSTIKPIDFVQISDNTVMYLYALQERFNDPNDSTKTNIRDIRFVATYRKENGVWKNSFTAFMDLPKSND